MASILLVLFYGGFMNQNQIQAQYFEKMLLKAEANQLSEPDVLQLYQDMANTGYAFTKQETSIHCRLLMMKGILKVPKNYTLIPVTPKEVQEMVSAREKTKQLN
jgi:hypothetical protein